MPTVRGCRARGIAGQTPLIWSMEEWLPHPSFEPVYFALPAGAGSVRRAAGNLGISLTDLEDRFRPELGQPLPQEAHFGR